MGGIIRSYSLLTKQDDFVLDSGRSDTISELQVSKGVVPDVSDENAYMMVVKPTMDEEPAKMTVSSFFNQANTMFSSPVDGTNFKVDSVNNFVYYQRGNMVYRRRINRDGNTIYFLIYVQEYLRLIPFCVYAFKD